LTSQSVVETLLTAPHVSIGGVTLAHGRIPNSLTQDGPCLVCSLSSGSGALIPLLTLPATLLQPRGKSSTTKKCATPVVANKLADLLNAKPERLSLAGCDKTGSIEEQIEHVMRITRHLRQEHMARGVAVREAIEEEATLIRKTRQGQNRQIDELNQLKGHVRSKAESLGDKFETIQEKQIELELRVAKLTRHQESTPLSKTEKQAGRELRLTDRQLAHFHKSITRAKMMCTEFTRLDASRGAKKETTLSSVKNVMRPLADFSGRLESIMGDLKKIQID